MKFVGTILFGLVIIAVTGSMFLGMAVGLFAYFLLDRTDLSWLRK